ncbi:MAG: HU family DNA-binding protein [Parabacteroides distasonis]|nr:HU family DNA-binding protein [Parabacteroides distasonis]
MPLKYKLIQRKDFSKDAPKDGKKYYAAIVSNGTVSTDELCESIAEETALTSADAKSFMDRLPRILARHLREGRNVQVGELGSFRPTMGSNGVAEKKDFNAATMMFTPGRKLQEARDNMTFARVKEPNETTSDTESPDEI